MKHIRHAVAVVALGLAALVGFAPTASAASPAQVTITFRLTLSGTVPAHDNFLVTFGENGAQFCGPCVGGHTYVAKVPWPKGTATVSFRLVRETLVGCVAIGQGSSSCPPKNQHEFARFNVRPTANQTFNATFAYGTAPVAQPPVPATGSAPATESVPATGADAGLLTAAGLVAFGATLLLVGSRRRRRSSTLRR